MISVEAAVALVLKQIRTQAIEEVPLLAARGRVLARDMRAGRQVPPFANSAMDGFAVRWRDVASAPVTLRIIETIAAGYVAKQPVAAGTAMRIMTGAPVPRGCDAIVRVEDAECSGDHVHIKRTDGPQSHIRKAGEDIRKGQLILDKGKPLSAADLGLLASVGQARIAVFKRPTVAIISTGDELVNVEAPPVPGKIVNSNSYTLAAAVEAAGALPQPLGIARDNRRALAAALKKALRYDVVLTSGGVSVGDYDFVKEVLGAAGMRMNFWRVAQRPGHPMAFGWIGKKPVFGLPGNPVSSLVSFLLYARPALLKMMGHGKVFLPVASGVLEHDIEKTHRLKEFVRCRIRRDRGELFVASTGTQSSGVLRSLSLAQGLMVLQENDGSLQKGTTVPVILLDAGDRLQAQLGF